MAHITVPTEGRPLEQLDSGDILVGIDGNAFVVMATTAKALRRAGASKAFEDAYRAEAMSGDYDHLLATSMAYLDADINYDES